MKKILALVVSLLMCFGFSAPALAQEEKPFSVVTSFYPLYIFAQNILKDVPGVTLNNLTHPSTGCLHDYQLLAGDMRSLSLADALIINGGGMEGFLDTLSGQFLTLSVIDSSQGITLIRDEEPEHKEGETPEEHAAHEHGEYNAHIWLDPRNAIQMSRTIAAGLIRLMPDREALINQNTQEYTERLSALDEELTRALSGLEKRDIVTFHEAFPYFAQAYGLNVVAVMALEPDEALTPLMLSGLVDKVVAFGLPPLFTEPQYEDRAARAVAMETGAKIYELDPVVTGDGSPDAYERVMRSNAQALIAALGDE